MIKCGEYMIYHKEDAGKAGSHQGGPWFFEPEDWQGEVYSEGYPCKEEAVDACISWREIPGDEDRLTQREFIEKQRQDSIKKALPDITDLLEAKADSRAIAELISDFRDDEYTLIKLITYAIDESLRIKKG